MMMMMLMMMMMMLMMMMFLHKHVPGNRLVPLLQRPTICGILLAKVSKGS